MHDMLLLHSGRKGDDPLSRDRNAETMLDFDKFDIDFFSILFSDELESWLLAGIACCDSCYGTYEKTWPGITSSVGFQVTGIPLTAFYSGSRLQSLYSEDEFMNLVQQLG